jgi:hypothetical protein
MYVLDGGCIKLCKYYAEALDHGANLLESSVPSHILAMAVIITCVPSPVQIPDNPNDSHPEFAWVPVMVLLFFALFTFILVGAPG